MLKPLLLAGLALAVPVSAESRDTRSLKVETVAALKAAPTQGQVVSITTTDFAGQVLKADTIAFTSNSRLRFTGTQPWVAIVARRLLVAAPIEKFTIVTGAGPAAKADFPRQPSLGRARDGNGGEPGSDGEDGAPGVDGNDGHYGANGINAPGLIIIANEIIRQDGTVPPTFADVVLDTRGQNGQNGQAGQDGQDGGNGGSGGAGRSGFGCEENAGNGGNGGSSGLQGIGGWGGLAGSGGDIFLGGSTVVMDLLSFARVDATGGKGGNPGVNGSTGTPGAGGPRGPHSGLCGGGSPGREGQGYNRPGEADSYPDRSGGLIYYVPIDATTLF